MLDIRCKIGKNGKYLIQNLIETILLKHGIQEIGLGKEWFLKIGKLVHITRIVSIPSRECLQSI